MSGICAVLGFYALYNGSSVPTFRNNLSVLSLRVKQPKTGWLLKMKVPESLEMSANSLSEDTAHYPRYSNFLQQLGFDIPPCFQASAEIIYFYGA